MDLDEAARTQLAREAVPYLMRQANSMQLPDQPGTELELPMLGESILAFEGASAHVFFTEHSTVDVVPSGEGVLVTMEHLEASLGVDAFSLARKAGKFSTKGQLTAHVLDVSMKAFVSAKRSGDRRRYGGVTRTLSIDVENVGVGRVLLSVSKSCLSWMYNMAMQILKSRIQAALKHIITANLEGFAEPISQSMEFVPIVILAVMQAESDKQETAEQMETEQTTEQNDADLQALLPDEGTGRDRAASMGGMNNTQAQVADPSSVSFSLSTADHETAPVDLRV